MVRLSISGRLIKKRTIFTFSQNVKMRNEADEADEAQPEPPATRAVFTIPCASSLIFHRRSASFELERCARNEFSPRFVRFVSENALSEFWLKKRFFKLGDLDRQSLEHFYDLGDRLTTAA
jgi:hypothetical protein